MIKKFLLAGSVLSLAVATTAAKEVYVIKDGKMVNCEFVPSSEPDTSSVLIAEGKSSAGDMVKVTSPKAQWKAGMLYLPEAVDLSETWVLEMEYFFEKDFVIDPLNAKHEGWALDLMADTLPVGDVTWECSASNTDYRISHVSIDTRLRDFVDAEGVEDSHGAGTLQKVSMYVHSTPLAPRAVGERDGGNKVKAMFIALFAEAQTEQIGYIKNLKFVSDGTKPFYADKMANLNGEGTIYQTNMKNQIIGAVSNDAEIVKLSDTNEKIGDPRKMYGQQLFVSNNDDGNDNEVLVDRMYIEANEQLEAGFFDTEYGFLPYLKRSALRSKFGDVADAQLRIPLGVGAVEKNIAIQMRLGHNAGESGDLTPYANYKKSSSTKDIFPVQYRFETGDVNKISTKTDWQQLRPTYTKGGDDYVDSIPTMMNEVFANVELPSKEYTHITLRFVPDDVISYMFGDIRLTGDTNWWPKRFKDYVLTKNYKGYELPSSFQAGVENVIAKGEISIYPNPASDVITVTNEGVESVAVYSVAGSLVASSESNVVNIANLVKGIYVVKANTEAGVVTGQIIKK